MKGEGGHLQIPVLTLQAASFQLNGSANIHIGTTNQHSGSAMHPSPVTSGTI